MTTIAWDGRTMSGDSKMCNEFGAVTGYVTKVRRAADGRVAGFTGNFRHAEEFVRWLDGDRPEPPRGDYNVLVADPARRTLRKFEPAGTDGSEGGWLQLDFDAPHALGSGRDFAAAAMHLGKDARSAVMVASDLDVHTGGVVTTAYCGPTDVAEWPQLQL